MSEILVINPGSTSTKVGLFEDETPVFTETVMHDSSRLAAFNTLADQLPYRRDCVLELLASHGVDLTTVDAFVGRGGGVWPLVSGTYNVGPLLLDHAANSANGVVHPANLACLMAHEFAHLAHPEDPRPVFMVNPPDVDELCDEARMTGIKGVYRHSRYHALNLKETAIRHAAKLGRRYDECDFVVCHIGGGISVTAHRHGRMIDGTDIVGGEGPMTPTRCGAIPVSDVLDLVDSGRTTDELRLLLTKSGGFVDLLGTSDTREVEWRAEEGDEMAFRAWKGMLYQLNRCIGSMATALEGHVDGILLSGGMVHSAALVASIEKGCGWIAPVTAYPGEFELEAMVAGALRVLRGEERAREYTSTGPSGLTGPEE